MTGPLDQGDLVGDRYEIVRYIDAGSMQFVYEAKDVLTDRRVALKTPKNTSASKRFKRSAIVAAQVNHPNVAKTLDYLRVGDDRYLIEELIEGRDLSKALLQETRFVDPYLAAKILHHLAKGVAAAHHAGVIHRDLKPSNIMVMGGYSLHEIKVTDFGIAKLAGEVMDEAIAGGTASMFQSATVMGALPYMAPEAIDTPAEVGRAADVWSLGAMMYHMLTGQTPYGEGLRSVRAILAAEPPAQPAFLTANPQFAPLASEVMDLALSCMQRDPSDRPSADHLVASCGNLCYTPGERTVGTVKTIYDHGRFGWLSIGRAKDVFFHVESVYGPEAVKENDRVLLASYDGGGGDRAHPVMKLGPAVD
ncbi:serine/threonine-protein kinase [Variovorax sp. KK3]|uniref:serine/threonine-protein kinase n=1 Tax=Variovorax sp. KK3 TaxID=1855728 RepID=UPI00097C6870|nr:serine/threonine-protein kinase [Variovorax sp. KK3]